ncbi:DUF86 domain-containing protein [Pararobbsia silviterrae]|uniref:DUF86 domain-containing protein n=1 Tax=Pararobbsia silviterrae TaxID=1792498 RepID=A0A494XYW8_9BURK|nr:DUF86 domain-containing protein [Pararobbsia silviterrae]RKP55754.1 DUF86 domain-containing protein [Pararobbsia silviterrae]
MTRDVQRLPDYLNHIVEAIDRIARYTDSLSEDDFLLSDIVQDAVIRNLEIIGEAAAARNISHRYPEFAETHVELPLSAAYEMRNVLAHGYFTVDLGIVWKTIQRNLPPLREAIVGVMSEAVLRRTASRS